MAWNKQGGPWGGGGGGQGPWGGGGPGRPGGGGGGGMQPPDLEETLRRAQERVKRFMPGGSGGAKGIVLVLIAVIAIWLGSGFYRVQPEQQGVELLFGQYVQQTQPGLNYWLPSPIGTVYTPFGQLIILLLIQFGGIGIITVGRLVMLRHQERLDPGTRELVAETFGILPRVRPIAVLHQAVIYTGICELLGFLLLAPPFIARFGWSEGLLGFHGGATEIDLEVGGRVVVCDLVGKVAGEGGLADAAGAGEASDSGTGRGGSGVKGGEEVGEFGCAAGEVGGRRFEGEAGGRNR